MKQDLSALQEYAAPGTPDLSQVGIEAIFGVAFRIPTGGDCFIQVLASELNGWDHISATAYWPRRDATKPKIIDWATKTLTRDEIHRVRDMFFEEGEKVLDIITPEKVFLDREQRKAVHLWSPQSDRWPEKWPWLDPEIMEKRRKIITPDSFTQ